MKPGERRIVRHSSGLYQIVECVGILSEDIPAANARAGDPLTITWPEFFSTRIAAADVARVG